MNNKKPGSRRNRKRKYAKKRKLKKQLEKEGRNSQNFCRPAQRSNTWCKYKMKCRQGLNCWFRHTEKEETYFKDQSAKQQQEEETYTKAKSTKQKSQYRKKQKQQQRKKQKPQQQPQQRKKAPTKPFVMEQMPKIRLRKMPKNLSKIDRYIFLKKQESYKRQMLFKYTHK